VSEFMSRQTFEYITDSQVRNTVERLLKVWMLKDQKQQYA
jgi:hypothetical protein